MTSPIPYADLPGRTTSLVDTINQIPELATGITLENILSHMASIVKSDEIFFTLRRGEVLNLQASWPDQSNFQGLDIPIQSSPILQSIFETQTAILLDNISAPMTGLSALLPDYAKSWMGIPAMIGQRIIAVLVFTSEKSDAFSSKDKDIFFSYVQHISNVIEHAILFEEATRYLHQLALVNELAAVASSAMDIDEVAKRILQRMRLIFELDWAKVTLLASERSAFREYGEDGLMDKVHSEISTPLRHQGQVIGTISLQSRKYQAFTTQDYQLLQIISSHLAGVFENMRLNRETQEHAQILAETVRQLKATKDTALDIAANLDLETLLHRIVERARDLVDGRGAVLGLLDHQTDHPSGTIQITVSNFPKDFTGDLSEISSEILQRILSENAAILNDRGNWTVVGVPLALKGGVIGGLMVVDDRPGRKFNNQDIQLLQLLVPQAAISIHNAQLYAQTQLYIRQLKESQTALIRAEKMASSGRLMASIAHEINNPLQALQNCLHLVGRQELEAGVRENYLLLAQTELTRLMNTVQRMLDYFRPASLDRKPTNVHEILDKTLALVEKQLEHSGISVKINYGCDFPNTLAVSDQLQQVFLNIILNAEQANKNGGVLTISTLTLRLSETQPQIEILFADTGPGIPEQLREKIFDPFISDKEDGHGLGLAISYGIISAHDGTLELVNGTNQGACFRIVLNAIIPNGLV